MTKILWKTAASCIALGLGSNAHAQHAGHMPGIVMPAAKPAPAKKRAAVKAAPRASVKKPVARKAAATPARAKPAPAKPAAAPTKVMDPAPVEAAPVDHAHMHHAPAAPVPTADEVPAPSVASPTLASPADAPIGHSTMDHDEHGDAGAGTRGGGHAMLSALGPYSSTRDASGTAWQPDSSQHRGLMFESGGWDVMLHGNLDVVVDTQGGPRGDDKIFPAGMVMAMASRHFAGGDAFQLKAMLSPDPLMGKRGYPLLLASGETANGRDRLIDRQHPHDLFMELSASVSLALGDTSSAFVYAGLPGEPAFGPPAFMHRQSISVSPEAPITHHWLDSTHITFGVVTAGLVVDGLKLELSRFNGREPDQKRFDIETGPLDSTALRLSWNPSPELSLQGSWAHLTDPEQLEPGVDQRRWSASAIYTRQLSDGWWSSTLAWGRKTIEGDAQDAVALESAYKRGAWTMFGRGEMTENNELLDHGEHGHAYRVSKASLGLARDFDLAGPLGLTIGALGSINFIPDALRGDYGRRPLGAMAFVRLRLD